MEPRYLRNRIYLDNSKQEIVRRKKVIIGGVGLGSVIAECALRFGFENLTIIDGDKVEISNLNRQNYNNTDIGKYKVEALTERLKSINPRAEITSMCLYINKENVKKIVNNYDIAINALDFSSDTPFLFDDLCQKKGIPILHPYNFGWAGYVTVINPQGPNLRFLSKEYEQFELKVVNYVTQYSRFWGNSKQWLEDIKKKYTEEKGILPPPQLSIASWIVAGYCVNIMYNLSIGKEIKYFPKFYMSSTICDNN